MDRGSIKETAKTKIKGNKWNIIWPLLVIGVINSVITSIFGGGYNVNVTELSEMSSVSVSTGSSVTTIVSLIVTGVLTGCYLKYLLNFARTGEFKSSDIIDTLKEKWLNLLIASVLVSIIVSVCTLLFIIPGIIMALAYGMTTFIIIDSDTQGADALKKSREMMNGYKGNYLLFQLSFIGWYILVPFTLGILLIWLIPYHNIAEVEYYEKLKSLRNAN